MSTNKIFSRLEDAVIKVTHSRVYLTSILCGLCRPIVALWILSSRALPVAANPVE
jgi:hypothetical protein